MSSPFDPREWGRPMWHTLYVLALAADHDEAKDPTAFDRIILTLPDAMPCETCANHFGNFVQASHPAAAESKVEYVLRAENAVRKRQGRTPLTRQNVMDRINSTATIKPAYWAIGIVTVVFFLFVFLAIRNSAM